MGASCSSGSTITITEPTTKDSTTQTQNDQTVPSSPQKPEGFPDNEETKKVPLDQTTKEMQNWYHLCYLVMKVGTDAIKQVLTKKCLGSVPLQKWINDNRENFEKKAKDGSVILKPFIERLNTGKFDEDFMDFSLTVVLIDEYLRSVSRSLPPLGLPNKPEDNDREWPANVSRLKKARNTLAHNYQLTLSDEVYEQEKANVDRILKELGADEEVVTRVIKITPSQRQKLEDFGTSVVRYVDELEKEDEVEEDNEEDNEEEKEEIVPDFIESTITRAVNSSSDEPFEAVLESATEMLKRAVQEHIRLCIDDGSEEQIRPVTLTGDDLLRLIFAFDFRWNGWRLLKQMPTDLEPAHSDQPEVTDGEKNELQPVTPHEVASQCSVETQTDTITEIIHVQPSEGGAEDGVTKHSFADSSKGEDSPVRTPQPRPHLRRRRRRQRRPTVSLPAITSPYSSPTLQQEVEQIKNFCPPPPSRRRPLIDVVAVRRGENDVNSWYVTTRYDAGPRTRRANRKDLTDKSIAQKHQQLSIRPSNYDNHLRASDLTRLIGNIRIPWDVPTKFQQRYDF